MMYRHYKGEYYYTLGITTRVKGAYYIYPDTKLIRAKHTETEKDVHVFMREGRFYVLYENNANLQLYIGEDGRFWLRPRDMFHGTLEVDGQVVTRFKLIGG